MPSTAANPSRTIRSHVNTRFRFGPLALKNAKKAPGMYTADPAITGHGNSLEPGVGNRAASESRNPARHNSNPNRTGRSGGRLGNLGTSRGYRGRTIVQ